MKTSGKISAVVLAMVCALGLAVLAKAAATAVPLGTADSFAVLSGAGITNTGSTVITGDVGTYPTLTETGFGSVTLTGTNHAGDATTQGAKNDLTTAYNTAVGEGPISAISADLGGQILSPGVYNSGSSIGLTGTLTLDGGGDPNAVFVFQAGSTLTTASASVVKLINNAQACNVFWQVGSSATLGTNSIFKGDILALTSATLNTGTNVEGRVLAQNGAVTLDTNTITKAVCGVVAPPPSVPTCTLTANPTVIQTGNSSTLSWTTTNATSFSINNGIGSVTPVASGSTPVSPVTTTLYTGTAAGTGGSVPCAATVTPTPAPVSAGGNGNNYLALLPPLINVTKIPNPLALPSGPGSVTYIYTVKNVGTVPMTGVTVVDNKCSPMNFVSGDTNGNSQLDTNETWIYHCTTTLSQTTTNTVTATGNANGFTAIDTADATVVVGAPVVPPLIHLVKTPDTFILPAGGGAVTYTYAVTNPGTVPLSNVTVTDDKCSSVNFISGDTNKNSLLDSNETWTFACKSNLVQTTTNTGTAEGSANGLTVYDFSPATVVVAPPGVVISPKLPNTGLPPYGASTESDAALVTGILMVALISFAIVQRKRKV
jgi:uncharacterized repeat protein (TIGR01451 family)